MRVAFHLLLVLVAVWSSNASPSKGRTVKYETPGSQVQVSWHGNSGNYGGRQLSNDNGNDGDNDGDWGWGSGSWGGSGWRTVDRQGGWRPSNSYGPPSKQYVVTYGGGDGGSSSEEGGDGGSYGGYGGGRGKGKGKGGDNKDGDNNDTDNNNDNGDGNQAEISVKTTTDKDGKVQKEIDIELNLNGADKTGNSALDELMALLGGSNGGSKGGNGDAKADAAADAAEAAQEKAEAAGGAGGAGVEAGAGAEAGAEAGAGAGTGAEAGAGSAGGSTMVDLKTADVEEIADILRANNINTDLMSIIEFARKELGAATKTELEVVQGDNVVGVTENADAKAEAAMEAKEAAAEAAANGGAEAGAGTGGAAVEAKETGTGSAAGGAVASAVDITEADILAAVAEAAGGLETGGAGAVDAGGKADVVEAVDAGAGGAEAGAGGAEAVDAGTGGEAVDAGTGGEAVDAGTGGEAVDAGTGGDAVDAGGDAGITTDLIAPQVGSDNNNVGGDVVASNWERELNRMGKYKGDRGDGGRASGERRNKYRKPSAYATSFLNFGWGRDDNSQHRQRSQSYGGSSGSKVSKSRKVKGGYRPTSIQIIDSTYRAPSPSLPDLSVIDSSETVDDGIANGELSIPEPVYDVPAVSEYRAPLFREHAVVRRPQVSYGPPPVKILSTRYGPPALKSYRRPATIVHSYRPAKVKKVYRQKVYRPVVKQRRVVYHRPASVKYIHNTPLTTSYRRSSHVSLGDDLW